MSKIVTFKVPDELKAKMDKFRGRVNWSELLRNFVAEKIKELEAEENLMEVVGLIEETEGVKKGFSVGSVREDRDSG